MRCSDSSGGSASVNASKKLSLYDAYTRPVCNGQIGREGPTVCLSPGLDDLEEHSAYLEQAISPGPVAPQETVHTPGLTSSTVSPLSARSRHIETPSSAAIEPPPSANPLGDTTYSAHQLASEHAELSPSGEYMVTHTGAPSKRPPGDTLAPVPGVTTQGRFRGQVYESRHRFRSAPASNRMEDVTVLSRQVAHFMGVGQAEGASTG